MGKAEDKEEVGEYDDVFSDVPGTSTIQHDISVTIIDQISQLNYIQFLYTCDLCLRQKLTNFWNR